ncbi:MAG: RIP metalloprotease RseP [Acidobacteria bacterium]|nr:RIP metalloprotease RseP [Acidobacteriota bacterium]
MVLFQNIWWVLVLIGIMILIHELGHFWAARFFDVRVEAFSFGFGPRLFGFRRGETDFRVSLILFGGYVKMTGEQTGEDGTPDSMVEDPRSFQAKPRWQRMIIAFAGPGMNILLALALLTGLFMYRYPKVVGSDGPAFVGFIAKDSVAAKAGIKEGDRIVRFDNIADPTWEDVTLAEIAAANRPVPVVLKRATEQVVTTLTPALHEQTGVGTIGWGEQHEIQLGGVSAKMEAERVGLKSGDLLVALDGVPLRSTQMLLQMLRDGQGKPVELSYSRDGATQKVAMTPSVVADGPNKRYMLGVQLSARVTYVQLPVAEAFNEAARQNYRSAGLILQFLQGLVERRMSAKSLEGPIGIARLSGDAAREGMAPFIGLMAAVSLNLAIFNLLPIPILDGGTILMLAIEMIMRRDLSLHVKETVFKLGFVFLMMVVAFVLYNDISKLLPG